ncbi:MAG: hypothetical protein AABW80_02545 [Nanoarchaeota archaeon]
MGLNYIPTNMGEAIRENAKYSMKVSGVSEVIDRLEIGLGLDQSVRNGDTTHAIVLSSLLSQLPKNPRLRRHHQEEKCSN